MSYRILLLTAGLLFVANTLAGQPEPAANAQTNPSFDLLDFQIEGNTVLDDETLEKAVYPFLGPDKTLDDVEKARAALDAAYRNAGYQTVVVSVPPQDVDAEGRVRINVTEGSIETVYVTGSRYYSPTKIRETVPELAEGQVPHMPTVQNQMMALGKQAADRNVTPVLRAGSTPGKMEVELRVKDELPLHGSLEMNSRSTSNTTYSRLVGKLRYDNLWQLYHSASIQYQLSPQNPNQVELLTGTYVLPTGWQDTYLSLYTISSHSNSGIPGIQVGDLAVIGNGTTVGMRFLKPLSGWDGVTQSLSAGVDYKSFGTSTTSNTVVDYLKFVTAYEANWITEAQSTNLNLTGHFSFRGLGNTASQFASKRTDDAGQPASPDFMYLAGNFKNSYNLPEDFMLQSRLQGQVSSTFLINNEQFSAGGPLSVRGYHQSQVLGDNGLNLSMELHSPHLLRAYGDTVQNFRTLVFSDWAGLWSSNQLPSPNHNFLASAGLGLRLKMFRNLTGEFDWSYPMLAYTSLNSQVGVGQQRVDFRMLYEF